MTLSNNYQKSHIATWYTIAVVYALIIGNQPIAYRIFDGCLYGSILLLTGGMLRNIFRYVFPRHYGSFRQVPLIIATVLLISCFIVGIETFGMYLFHPPAFAYFVTTIPTRLFITCLLIIIFRLRYLVYDNATESPNKTITNQPTTSTSTIDRIIVRNGQKIKIIPIDDIIYIQADGDYISIHTTEGNYLKEQTMKHTENILPANLFIRIHRSYIVNINQISRIERYGERQQIILHNKEKIKISAARYQPLKQQLGI